MVGRVDGLVEASVVGREAGPVDGDVAGFAIAIGVKARNDRSNAKNRFKRCLLTEDIMRAKGDCLEIRSECSLQAVLNEDSL